MFIYLVTPVIGNTETGFNFHWYGQGHSNTSLHVAQALNTSLEARRTRLQGVRRSMCGGHNLLTAWLLWHRVSTLHRGLMKILRLLEVNWSRGLSCLEHTQLCCRRSWLSPLFVCFFHIIIVSTETRERKQDRYLARMLPSPTSHLRHSSRHNQSLLLPK